MNLSKRKQTPERKYYPRGTSNRGSGKLNLSHRLCFFNNSDGEYRRRRSAAMASTDRTSNNLLEDQLPKKINADLFPFITLIAMIYRALSAAPR